MNRIAVAVVMLVIALEFAKADQFERFGDWQVHYIAFNAALLSAEIAERYGLVRGRNKGLVNITAVGPAGRGRRAKVEGSFRNLLDQRTRLDFREIDDAGTIYYLAAFDFDDGENLRFEISVDLPGHGPETLRFQQPLYFEDP